MYEKIILIFFGGIVTYIFQQYRAHTSEELSQVNEHIKDIEKFSDLSIQYWSKKYESYDDDIIMVAKILAIHELLLIQYQQVSNYCEAIKYDYSNLFYNLYLSTTGGEFNTQGRHIDHERVSDILDITHTLIHKLRNERIYIISLSRFFLRFLNRLIKPHSKPWLLFR